MPSEIVLVAPALDGLVVPDEGPSPTDAAAAYLTSLQSPASRRTMRSSLDTVARLLGHAGMETCPWARLRHEHLQALRTILAERYAPTTANKHLHAVRGVLRQAFLLRQLSADAWQRVRELKPVRGSRPPAGRALSYGEVEALFRACETGTRQGARDAALVALLYGCGLRRAEALGVDLADLDLADLDRGAATVVVRGKGNKHRVAPVPPGTRAALAAWLAVRQSSPGPLITSVLVGWRGRPRRLSEAHAALALDRLARAAGLRHFSPHDLRRTYASHLLDRGVDLAMVKQLMGHASIATTTKYDHRAAAEAARAAMGLHVPFGGT